ncbi:hypothetical protein CKO41_13055 [Thiococcus pfennigii]|nr:hypothetical protein [Thiococcus pfennigii]MBK1732695.1 hypothetical protein [Thiococcus pfennigii]
MPASNKTSLPDDDQRGIRMFISVISARKPIRHRLAMLLVGLATLSMCLQGVSAEPEDLGLQDQLDEAQAELQALQDSFEESRSAYEECRRELNIASGRIEGLKTMLGGVQGGDVGHRTRTSGQTTNAWDLVDRLLALNAEGTEQGIRLSLPQQELAFRSGTAGLPPGKMPSLDQIAALLVEHAELTALVEGHTDSAGPTATNLALSQERADAVRQALIDRGVGSERLAATGFGEARPIATNATSTGRSQNRRVEIYLVVP